MISVLTRAMMRSIIFAPPRVAPTDPATKTTPARMTHARLFISVNPSCKDHLAAVISAAHGNHKGCPYMQIS